MAGVSLGPDASATPSSSSSSSSLSLASRLVHADSKISVHRAVAPAMHVSTTFRYHDDPNQLIRLSNIDETAPQDSHVYSRVSNPNSTRLEAVLSSILGGPALTYTSGLSAFHALLVHLNPRRIAIGGGYHGCHGVIRLVSRLTGLKQLDLDCDDSELGPGDVVHVETPLNPSGEARNLLAYAEKARRVGAYLSVDATFGPPPLQDPFLQGADIVMHSGTKYFGGHSDMLCGVLAVNPKHADWAAQLAQDRLLLGSVMGSLEGWLGVRSLRTLELRVTQQSKTAAALVSWLAGELKDPSSTVATCVQSIQHASLQEGAAEEDSWLRKQMPGGYGPVFSIVMKNQDYAKSLPSKLHLFHHATSLGGVESLIEWRAMSDTTVDPCLLRVSIGVEGMEDLKQDIQQALEALQTQVA
ncbi:pyridoxal phosphate-dependent transferase [Stachybotrys elegans]|uniref:Pyridoxal phosphate-dependent transferase n=1 Tax=Stachybotrys elegans TaxID=80388 RepID=A0A8K0T874_9HYPO|nr:pyridoxal phosphate-dependent transferase [Stachybotrys elegans]